MTVRKPTSRERKGFPSNDALWLLEFKKSGKAEVCYFFFYGMVFQSYEKFHGFVEEWERQCPRTKLGVLDSVMKQVPVPNDVVVRTLEDVNQDLDTMVVDPVPDETRGARAWRVITSLFGA